jgi:acetyl-CoA carboxylase biotin carboxyl carrier protein
MTKDNNDADVAFVQALAEVLRKNDLAELEVERGTKTEGRLSVRISRATQAKHVAVAQPVAPAPHAAPAAAPAAADSQDPADLPGAVTSPMVGTVYLQPEPGQDPFVKVGDMVTEGQTLLIVEAMKTMNHIPAPKAGTVRRILVEDRAPVEYGAPLMIVD